jgi:hypothetical protein
MWAGLWVSRQPPCRPAVCSRAWRKAHPSRQSAVTVSPSRPHREPMRDFASGLQHQAAAVTLTLPRSVSPITERCLCGLVPGFSLRRAPDAQSGGVTSIDRHRSLKVKARAGHRATSFRKGSHLIHQLTPTPALGPPPNDSCALTDRDGIILSRIKIDRQVEHGHVRF